MSGLKAYWFMFCTSCLFLLLSCPLDTGHIVCTTRPRSSNLDSTPPSSTNRNICTLGCVPGTSLGRWSSLRTAYPSQGVTGATSVRILSCHSSGLHRRRSDCSVGYRHPIRSTVTGSSTHYDFSARYEANLNDGQGTACIFRAVSIRHAANLSYPLQRMIGR